MYCFVPNSTKIGVPTGWVHVSNKAYKQGLHKSNWFCITMKWQQMQLNRPLWEIKKLQGRSSHVFSGCPERDASEGEQRSSSWSSFWARGFTSRPNNRASIPIYRLGAWTSNSFASQTPYHWATKCLGVKTVDSAGLDALKHLSTYFKTLNVQTQSFQGLHWLLIERKPQKPAGTVALQDLSLRFHSIAFSTTSGMQKRFPNLAEHPRTPWEDIVLGK